VAAGKPTDFNFDYEFTIRGVHFDLDPEKIRSLNPTDEAVKRFTAESLHAVFTPEIKALSEKIVGNETNPMLKAKKIYDLAIGPFVLQLCLGIFDDSQYQRILPGEQLW